MTRLEAINALSDFEQLILDAFHRQDLGKIVQLTNDFQQTQMVALTALSEDVEHKLKEMQGGPFHDFLQSFWLHYKQSMLMLSIRAVIEEAAAAQEAMVDAAKFAELGDIVDGLKKK